MKILDRHQFSPQFGDEGFNDNGDGARVRGYRTDYTTTMRNGGLDEVLTDLKEEGCFDEEDQNADEEGRDPEDEGDLCDELEF